MNGSKYKVIFLPFIKIFRSKLFDNKLFNSKLSIFLQICFLGTMVIHQFYWLKPALEKEKGNLAMITANSLQEDENFPPSELIDILINFAKVNNDNLWIHKLEIKENAINLIIRSSAPIDTEKYISEITKISNLALELITTKNVDNKMEGDEKEEEEEEPMPYAIKLYLDSLNESLDSDENEDGEENKNETLLFSYETKITLTSKDN